MAWDQDFREDHSPSINIRNDRRRRYGSTIHRPTTAPNHLQVRKSYSFKRPNSSPSHRRVYISPNTLHPHLLDVSHAGAHPHQLDVMQLHRLESPNSRRGSSVAEIHHDCTCSSCRKFSVSFKSI